jgi:hypothetical protein
VGQNSADGRDEPYLPRRVTGRNERRREKEPTLDGRRAQLGANAFDGGPGAEAAGGSLRQRGREEAPEPAAGGRRVGRVTAEADRGIGGGYQKREIKIEKGGCGRGACFSCGVFSTVAGCDAARERGRSRGD